MLLDTCTNQPVWLEWSSASKGIWVQVQCSAVFWPILAQHALGSMYQSASVARWGFCKQAEVSERLCSVQPGELLLLCPLSPLNTLPSTLPNSMLNTAQHTAQIAFTAVHCPESCTSVFTAQNAALRTSVYLSLGAAQNANTIHIPITQVLPSV